MWLAFSVKTVHWLDKILNTQHKNRRGEQEISLVQRYSFELRTVKQSSISTYNTQLLGSFCCCCCFFVMLFCSFLFLTDQVKWKLKVLWRLQAHLRRCAHQPKPDVHHGSCWARMDISARERAGHWLVSGKPFACRTHWHHFWRSTATRRGRLIVTNCTSATYSI